MEFTTGIALVSRDRYERSLLRKERLPGFPGIARVFDRLPLPVPQGTRSISRSRTPPQK